MNWAQQSLSNQSVASSFADTESFEVVQKYEAMS
jgi:hypothetical protein